MLMAYANSNVLKLFHWNANGISNFSHLKQLEFLLEREHIQIASLNETYFNENHKPYFKNYYIYRSDRQGARGGGVALIVRKSIQHKLLSVISTHKIENISVEIVINQRPIVITNAYSPKYTTSFENDIRKLISGSKEFIILGDLNAKHSSWNCALNNRAGNVLFNLQQSCNFFLHHTNEPTYHPHQQNRSSSVLDVIISNSTLPMRLNVMGYEIPSDHRPIVCTINHSAVNIIDSSHFDYKQTNWAVFKSYIENRINGSISSYRSRNSIDRELDRFIKLILQARDATTPKVSSSNNYILPKDVIKLIKRRRFLKRKAQRSYLHSEVNFYNQCVKLLSIIINDRIKLYRNRKWNNMLSKLKPGDKSFWKISKHLRGKCDKKIPNLLIGSRQVNTDEEKAKLLADTFSAANNTTTNYKHSVEKLVKSKINSFTREELSIEDAVFTSLDELSIIIHSLKSSKSPGLDNISNLLIKNLPMKAFRLLVTVFNSCIRLNYFPKVFKQAKVIAVPKPNKPKTDPKNYRPISLLSNIGKLFEKIIHRRICDFVTENSIIADEQFGFKKNHSSVHQICRIKNIILENKRNKLSTGLILLDIEKAFDTVWHNGLIYKLLTLQTPKYLCRLVAEFLYNRSFIVSVNGVNSEQKTIAAGLPQGSTLSPLLYSIYTSDFSPPNYMKTAYYADDTALITSSKLTKALLKKMEKGLGMCNKYFNKWKIKINPSKTQAIIFPYNKSPKRIPTRQISFGNDTIPIQDNAKYLGVILDKKLTFKNHIDETRKKCIRITRALWPLLNKRSSLNLKNKNLIYKSIIRPSLIYACPVWYKAARTHLKKLQILQNKCLKIIYNKPWRFPTDTLHNECSYIKLDEFIKRFTENFYTKIENSSYQLIKDCREL